MKIQLIKSLTEKMEISSQSLARNLNLDGKELEDCLRQYLSKFTEGILDPDTAGKSPDRFILNLQNGILGDFSRRYIMIAYEQNDAVGILIALPSGEQQFHIFSLHVSPDYRHKGVGSMLLSKCINDMLANNVKEIILDVHTDNKPAYNLYRKFGFKEL